jgi:hypothetical protein
MLLGSEGCCWALHAVIDAERHDVFVRVHLQVPDGPDGQTAEMRAGDMMVVKYTTVAKLVQSGQVTLL